MNEKLKINAIIDEEIEKLFSRLENEILTAEKYAELLGMIKGLNMSRNIVLFPNRNHASKAE